jgi:hypothetical protein
MDFISFIKKIFIIYLLSLLLDAGRCIHAQSPLTRFTATQNEREFIISWTLATGRTCNGIKILRSENREGGFREIGFIGGICGSIQDSVSYEFMDINPAINRNQFYLLDLAELGFSDTLQAFLSYAPPYQVLLEWSPASQQYRLHAHPEFQPPLYIQVLDLTGRRWSGFIAEEVPFAFSIADLPIGRYIITVRDSRGLGSIPQYILSHVLR